MYQPTDQPLPVRCPQRKLLRQLLRRLSFLRQSGHRASRQAGGRASERANGRAGRQAGRVRHHHASCSGKVLTEPLSDAAVRLLFSAAAAASERRAALHCCCGCGCQHARCFVLERRRQLDHQLRTSEREKERESVYLLLWWEDRQTKA